MTNLWALGIIGMLLYAGISYWKIQRKVREAIPLDDYVWICEQVETSFILGVFNPRIYLPVNLPEEEQKYVLAHEHAHLSRRDHWWKPLGFLILTVYWFNPILWLAYILLCRDIELACDEKVIAKLGLESKKSYSMALLNCSVSRRSIAACPLAFGEVDVKNRIKSILNYKKPAFWLIAIAVVAAIVLAISFLTDPVTTDVGMIIDEMGYDIQEQREYVFTATISKDVLSEVAFTREGQSFKKDEVIVYATETTNVYLEKVFLSNDSDEYLCMMFNFSYHDLDKQESVILPYTKSDKGYTGTIRLKSAELADGMAIYDHAVSVVGRGPSEKFSIAADVDIVRSAFRYTSFKFVGNELIYRNESVNVNAPSQKEICIFERKL